MVSIAPVFGVSMALVWWVNGDCFTDRMKIKGLELFKTGQCVFTTNYGLVNGHIGVSKRTGPLLVRK